MSDEKVEWSDLTHKMQIHVAHYLGDACSADDAQCDGKCQYNAMEAARHTPYANPKYAARDNFHVKDSKVRRYVDQELERRLPSDVRIMTELTSIALSDDSNDRDKIKACTEILDFKEKYIKTRKIEHDVSDDLEIERFLGIVDEDDQ